MTKKFTKQLIAESYDKKGTIIEENVIQIAEKLSRADLKQYINALKAYEKKNTVLISLPDNPTESDQSAFQQIFENKKIMYSVDSALLLGAQIQDNDIVYNMNLKTRFENLIHHLGE